MLISKAFRHQFVVPDFSNFTKDIEDIYWKCKSNTDGKVAAYIPQLARVNPDYWGVSVCTIDGQRFSIGDVNIPFTLQSCSKPLTYAIALEKLGQEVVCIDSLLIFLTEDGYTYGSHNLRFINMLVRSQAEEILMNLFLITIVCIRQYFFGYSRSYSLFLSATHKSFHFLKKIEYKN